MKTMLAFGMVFALVGCASGTRLALSPDQCPAPTHAEAQLTKTVWK